MSRSTPTATRPTAGGPVAAPPAGADVRAAALRFLVAGGLNAALNYVLFRLFLGALGRRPGAPALAQAGAYAIGVAVGYAVNRAWTFRSDGAHARALPRFLTLYLGTLALSSVLIEAAVTAGGLPPTAAWVGATAVTTVINFVAQRRWVFAER